MITSLCSGITLGVYVPGLIFNRKLSIAGYPATMEVYENLLLNDKLGNIHKLKHSYHKSFKFALKARELSHENNNESLDSTKIDQLFDQWSQEERNHFIAWSGHWIPILEQFMKQVKYKVRVDVINVDAVLMQSFKPFNLNKENYRVILPFDWEKQKVTCFIDIDNKELIPYHSRNKRFLIHGGGWGIGTYQEKFPILEERGINLDVICYEESDYSNMKQANRYFMINPSWNAWEKQTNTGHTFPPFGEILSENRIEYSSGNEHSVYKIIKNNLAIISKPGGGTLLDSLASATPVIFLEPFGDGEQKNAMLFCKLGLGITLQDWIDTGCSLTTLENIHKNILELKSNTPSCIQLHYDK